jgi:hypothetical protein
VAAAGAAVVAFDPFERQAIGCPLHELTGLHCPGCGATRASFLLLHGDALGALRHNLLLLPIGIWLVGWWLHTVHPAATSWLAGWSVPLRDRSNGVRYTLFAAVIGFTVFRNLPTFDWLAPPDA